MLKLVSKRRFGAAPARFGAFALAAMSLLETGAKGPGLFWPIVGIAAIFVVALIIARFVRGDPYYERNAGRDRRDSGPVPWGGGDGGGDDGGGLF
jgi:hypothetical protein